MLLGDPQQLGQVSTGTHPEPVDHSALGWLIEGHDVLPSEFGYFLEHTHRMHPEVCRVGVVAVLRQPVACRDAKTAARTLAGHPPGVRTLIVDHQGRSTASPEEAAVIVDEISALIGTTWTDEHGTRDLRQSDVLVVAPYNAQVVALRDPTGGGGIEPTSWSVPSTSSRAGKRRWCSCR